MSALSAIGNRLCRSKLARLFWIAFFSARAFAAESPAPAGVIQTAAEVRDLTSEAANQHYPVRLRGVVTFFDERLFRQFIQDETAGIYLQQTNLPALLPGQLVEVEGVTSAGEFAPIVTPRRVKVLGMAAFPQAKPVSVDQLTSGEEDSQFVEIQGVVRAIGVDPQTQYDSIEVVSGGGRFKVLMTKIPVSLRNVLVDSTVKIRGVCASYFNSQRQLFDVRLLVSQPADLTIETSAPGPAPRRSIEELLQFTPDGHYGHRVKVRGTVIYRCEDELYIQDGMEGLYVQTLQSGYLQPGDVVEAVGFPAKGDYTPVLQDASFQKIGDGAPAPPAPSDITTDEALKGKYDCRLVRLEATLLERARHSSEQFVVLESGGFIFHAYLKGASSNADFADIQNDSKVAVTGVCRIEPGDVWQPGADWRAKSFRILLRAPDDIFVLAKPPWWNLERMLWAISILGLVVLATLAWVWILGRRVHKQTAIIRQQLQGEAAMKERYEKLFENANDMVFTHDESGKITSINKAGERFLQCSRTGVIAKNLVEFMPENQKIAARQWLEQVVKGVDVPAAEWDFIDAAGQSRTLEISSLLIEQDGRNVEVEGIGRDITERRRLERELLEISNREQRRIGHDLHDGVCQQLAGIAYLADILVDKLREKGLAESADAEKIEARINEATMQARAVARGLFPVRLEENGLVSALDELATTVGTRFKINCSFVCRRPPARVDNETALHLYYIAQEAAHNAARHGKASTVSISLEPDGNRFKLGVQDDGCGFQPAGANRLGMGIRIMRYRAKVAGAILDLQTRPDFGTLVTCVFNAEPEVERADDNE